MWRRSAVLGLGLLLAAGLLLLLISIITTEPPTEVNTRVLSSDRVNDSQPEVLKINAPDVDMVPTPETTWWSYAPVRRTTPISKMPPKSSITTKRCEKEWLSWKNRCYKWIRVHGSIRFGDYEESEETVRTSCRERSGVAEAQPISIRNSAEMEFLWKQHQKLNSSEPRFVTGLLAPYGTKEEGTDHFEWVDGTPTNDFLADPDNWYGGLPEHSDHFVSIYNGKFWSFQSLMPENDLLCYYRRN
ncbi:hypothetical protein QR680_012223 [Steinernema hermaphroditum]|uniref:C-type lectin domain-containing protein n=1 Tax=Steinernema hermaphroditum TaxID=289476 RepID=A0AA39M063_9BILA|nr:hypothetical protein QR680_012223 [Steinernema hermaphroditum]